MGAPRHYSIRSAGGMRREHVCSYAALVGSKGTHDWRRLAVHGAVRIRQVTRTTPSKLFSAILELRHTNRARWRYHRLQCAVWDGIRLPQHPYGAPLSLTRPLHTPAACHANAIRSDKMSFLVCYLFCWKVNKADSLGYCPILQTCARVQLKAASPIAVSGQNLSGSAKDLPFK